MSYVNALFIRKKTVDIKDSNKRRSIIVTQEAVKIKEIQELINIEKHKNLKLDDSIAKAEESMQKKVVEYEKQIKELREQIMYYRLHPTPNIDTINRHVEEAEKLHSKVIYAINDFKKQIDQQVKDQEKDTIKRFDLKLAKICNEIEDRKKKRVMELSSMANTEKKVAKDLENLRESAILVEKKNTFLEQENKRLEELITKRDIEFQEKMQEYYFLKRKAQKPETASKYAESSFSETPKLSVGSIENYEDKTERYESVIAKLRKQLELERRNLKQVRNSYALEIEDRTEMENIVRQLVEEIRETSQARNRNNSANEERAILIDNLLNSSEVQEILNRNPYQTMSRDDFLTS